MTEQNDRVMDGDELPPEVGNFPTTDPKNIPEDVGDADAKLKEAGDDE